MVILSLISPAHITNAVQTFKPNSLKDTSAPLAVAYLSVVPAPSISIYRIKNILDLEAGGFRVNYFRKFCLTFVLMSTVIYQTMCVSKISIYIHPILPANKTITCST